MMLEEIFKKHGMTIIGLAVIAVWGLAILTIMLSIISKSVPNI